MAKFKKDELQDDITDNPEGAFLKECLKEFLGLYPEFKRLFVEAESSEVEPVNEAMVKNWESVFKRVTCLYPEFKEAKKCQKMPLYALVAHYFVHQGFSSNIGILSQKGLVSSSSVGDVSVSYQASPYATKGNDFSYFLSLTPYGMEYLAWLQRQSGLLYVN